MVGAAKATTRRASQAPLHGTGIGVDRPPSAAGLTHAQPTGSAQPGAQHPSMDPTGTLARGGGGGAQYGRRASVARG